MNGKLILLGGLIAVGVFWLLQARTGAAAVAGNSIEGTDGVTYRLFQRADGAIVDQYGKTWV